MFLYYRTVKNNSIKLMIVGKHQKGKTTLSEHLSRVGEFEDSGMYQPPEEPNAKTVGIKIGIWKYCKYRGNPTNDHPTIEFYSWDYAGEVCMYVCICMLQDSTIHALHVHKHTICTLHEHTIHEHTYITYVVTFTCNILCVVLPQIVAWAFTSFQQFSSPCKLIKTDI